MSAPVGSSPAGLVFPSAHAVHALLATCSFAAHVLPGAAVVEEPSPPAAVVLEPAAVVLDGAAVVVPASAMHAGAFPPVAGLDPAPSENPSAHAWQVPFKANWLALHLKPQSSAAAVVSPAIL